MVRNGSCGVALCMMLCLFGVAGCGGDVSDTGGGGGGYCGQIPDNSARMIPGPGQQGYDAELEAMMDRYFVQFSAFSTAPFGWALDSYVGSMTDRAVIGRFVNNNPRGLGFTAFCRQDPECDPEYAVFRTVDGNTVLQDGMIKSFGEYGDLGMFGGVATAADLFRYAVMKDQGYPCAEIVEARQRVIRILEANHIIHTIAGVPGVIVRGIMLKNLGNFQSQVVPLFDAEGNPLPTVKRGVLREDQSGLYPDWLWNDETSKDQVDGYIFAMGAMWDVVADDPYIPQYLKDWLVEDARNFAHELMQVAPEMHADMLMRDGDGRLTIWCDLNPNVVAFSGCPGAASPAPVYSFNAIMGLGIMRVLYHVTGDEDIRAFYYDDLIAKRHWDEFTNTSALPMVDTGYSTNFSNVNMAFVAYYNALRYESDPAVRAQLQESLEFKLWDNGGTRQPSEQHQSFFDFIYSGLRAGGNDPGVVALGIETLKEFPRAPTFNDRVENCDASEIAQGWCLAVNGVEWIELAPAAFRFGGHNDELVAEHVVPRRLRGPSNFDWRSCPYSPNDGGYALQLNHGGEVLAAYWMGRYLHSGGAEDRNVSPIARVPVVPEAPGSLVATAMSERQINLAWEDLSYKETEYKIERRKPPFGFFSVIGAVAADVTAYQDATLGPATAYEYRIKAVNGAGPSGYSNAARATTFPAAAAPPAGAAGLIAVALDHERIRLTWSDLSTDEAGFKVQRDGGAGFATAASTLAGDTAYIDTGLSDGTTYQYQVIAFNSAGDAAPSNVAAAKTDKLPSIFAVDPVEDEPGVSIYIGQIEIGFGDAVAGPDVTVTVSDEVGPVSGTCSLDVSGTLLTFVPDLPILTMDTTYTVSVTVGVTTYVYSFATEGLWWTVDIDAGLGKTFAINLFGAKVVEPLALADLLAGLGVQPYLLVGVIDTDAGAQEMRFIGAIGDLSGPDPSLQNMTMPTILFPVAVDLSNNPQYVLGPFLFFLNIEGIELELQDMLLSGIFEQNYNYSGKGEFSAELDIGPLAILLGINPAGICTLMGSCVYCPSDPTRQECVDIYVTEMRAEAKPDPIEPIAAVTPVDLGGVTFHTVELTLLHPLTGDPEAFVDIHVTLSDGNGTVDGVGDVVVQTGIDGKVQVTVTDPDGGSDKLTMVIESAVSYTKVTSIITVIF
ncbi:MAG TPA: fibronectin type III domain-containing protein [bacterium]|nr:fibronectin type III domain-containing protein [bacterium]